MSLSQLAVERDTNGSLKLSQILRASLSDGVSWNTVLGCCRYHFELAGVVDFGFSGQTTAHAHSFFEMGFAVEGEGRLVLRQDSYPIKRDGLYLIRPGVTHKVVCDSQRSLSCIVIHIRSDMDKGTGNQETLYGLEKTAVSSNEMLGQVVRSWGQLFDSRSVDPVKRSLFARFVVSEILTQLDQDCGEEKDGLIERAKCRIEGSLAKKLEVSSLAKQLGVSERTLRRHFQKELNCSVMDYIHKKRIQLAKLQLLHHQSVTEVARQVGFESASQLSRLFRKQVGMSPKSWQKSQSPTRRLPSDVG